MEGIVSGLLRDVPIPRMFRVRQVFPDAHIPPEELPRRILEELEQKRLGEAITPGMRIAITAGSRGIANIGILLKTLVDFVRMKGGKPFLVAAMGSHGGATREGQLSVLSGFGITEQHMGCTILADMDVVKLGVHPEGTEVFIGRNAAEADGIIVCNRIKPHTCFHGPYESGLLKMMAIGLGKQIGADYCHKQGFQNMAKNIQLFGKTILEKAPILFGFGILENAFDQTAKLVALRRDEILAQEPMLMEEAKGLLPSIGVAECDVLVCDTIGKNFSGSGMDANITGTFVTPYASGGLKSQRVAVLDLSAESHHNGCGCGMAHATTRRFFEKMQFELTYPNVITSTVIENVRIPMVLQSDREAIQVCLRTCTGLGDASPRLVRISNSMEVEHILLSEQYLEEAQSSSCLVVETEPYEMLFDANGNLPDLGHIGG